MYEDQGLDDLWEWAKGHTERWDALKDWANNKVHVFDNQLDAAHEREERASAALHELAEEVADLSERIVENREELAAAEAERNPEKAARLRERNDALNRERDKLKERIDGRETREHKAIIRERIAIKTKKAWIERRLIYREKWRNAKKRDKPKWEDFMASGHSLNFSAAAKAEAAIGVVRFDLVVTSTFRSTVIPDSVSTSFHGPNVSPGLAVDIAGARMTEYQQDVFDRRQGDGHLLELFGPMNAVCLKNGAHTVLEEGTFLENLHDTHVHVAANG